MNFYSYLFKQTYGIVFFLEEWSSMPRREVRVFTTVLILSFMGWMNIASIFPEVTDKGTHIFFGLVCYGVNHMIFIYRSRYRKIIVKESNSYVNLFLSIAYVGVTVYFFVKTH